LPTIQNTGSPVNDNNLRGEIMKKPKVAFICVHNSCRSQIAEALGKHFAIDAFESFSAGTETKPQINQDAVRLIKEIYNIDMEDTQYSKLITELPDIDIVIKMGCNVICPFVDSKHEEDWGLEDPTGRSDEFFKEIINEIEVKVKDLAERIKNGKVEYY
jgi:arsenate reductase